MSLDSGALKRATNRDSSHTAQRIKSCHQVFLPSDAQNNDGVAPQRGKPVPATIGYRVGRPIAGSDATS